MTQRGHNTFSEVNKLVNDRAGIWTYIIWLRILNIWSLASANRSTAGTVTIATVHGAPFMVDTNGLKNLPWILKTIKATLLS